jgi:hypothetical protein
MRQTICQQSFYTVVCFFQTIGAVCKVHLVGWLVPSPALELLCFSQVFPFS